MYGISVETIVSIVIINLDFEYIVLRNEISYRKCKRKEKKSESKGGDFERIS